MNIAFIIAVIAVLTLLNSLYVSAEFAAISAKRPRLAQQAAEGNGQAKTILSIIENPKLLDTYIAACQLGITVTSLVLGYYGQAQLTPILAPFLARLVGSDTATLQPVAATIMLICLTVITVVIGELIPKNLGLQYAERIAAWTVLPIRWSMWFFMPLIWFFNGSGQLLLRLMGASVVAEHSHAHTPEEILMLVEESAAGGVLAQEEQRLLVNTLQLRDITARRVMVPRNRMFTASVTEPSEALLTLLARSSYSRLLLYEESVDNIVGFVHLKDLLCIRHDQVQSDAATGSIREAMRPVEYVPESQPAEDVMRLMQRTRIHVVVVVDEYGGTAGMITIEDLFEEIIGEFHDEFDANLPMIELQDNNRVLVQGNVYLDDLNEWLGIALVDEDVETIGGLVFSKLGRLPAAGDEVTIDGTTVRVERMDEHSVAQVSLNILPEQAQQLEEMLW